MPSRSTAQNGWPGCAREFRAVTHGLVVCCAAVAVAWRVQGLPYIGTLALHVAALLQLWWPLWRADTLRIDTQALGLTWRGAPRALAEAALWAAATTPVWLVCAWYAFTRTGPQTLCASVVAALQRDAAAHGIAHVVVHIASAIFTQLLGTALIEEVFWRGYVQPACAARLSTRTFLRLPVGTYVATLLFAAVHLLEDANPLRLATFFPGVVFALLRSRHGTLAGSVALHAWDNLSAQLLASAAR